MSGMPGVPNAGLASPADVQIIKRSVALKQLRRFTRGRDDAVIRIGSPADQNKLLTILKNPDHNSRNELLREIFRNFSGDAYGDYQWKKATGGWTTPKVPTVYGNFRSACRQLSQLSLDGGFISHLNEFDVKQVAPDQLDFWAIRDNFKEVLGYEIVWRGMMLISEELNAIKKHGILSSFPRNIAGMSAPLEEFEANVLSAHIGELAEAHFHHENDISPFVSVTDHRDIAIAMGRDKGCMGEGRKLYLFKMRIPKIDLISFSEYGIHRPSMLNECIEKGLQISVSIDGETIKHPWDDSVDRFLFWKIDPDEIVEITQLNISKSVINGREIIT